MEWWQKALVVPVRRAWIVIAARLRRKKDSKIGHHTHCFNLPADGRGVLVKLHDDVQTCAYEDVQVMWDILQRSETEKLARKPPSTRGARALVWLGCAASTSRRHNNMGTVLSERMDLPVGGAAAASIALS